MEPIVANTQLSFKRYYNVNIYMLLRRKVIWFLLALAFILVLIAAVGKDEDHTYAYLGVFYLIFVLLMPVFVYLSSKKFYRKIAHMREPKIYEFDDEHIKITGQTVKMEMAWSNINKAVKRKDDYLLFSSNSRNFFNLPYSAFPDDYTLGRFETLVRKKVSKRNF